MNVANTKFLFLVLLVIMQTACSSSIKKNLAIGAAAGALGGYIYGQNKSENKDTYSSYYSAIGATIGVATTVFLKDPDKENQELKAETEKLKSELSQFQDTHILHEMPGTLSSKIPTKYKNLIQPGEWKVSAIDQWIEDGENRIIHQDKIMELTPPTLKPNSNRGKK